MKSKPKLDLGQLIKNALLAGYSPATTHTLTTTLAGNQMVDGQWYRERWGMDSLQAVLEAIVERESIGNCSAHVQEIRRIVTSPMLVDVVLEEFSGNGLEMDIALFYLRQNDGWKVGPDFMIYPATRAEVEGDRACPASSFQREIHEWSQATFPHQTPASKFEHLRREIAELGEDFQSGEEYGDCLLLLLGLAEMHGIDAMGEAVRKLEINRQRQWGYPDEHGVSSHIPMD